jgi:AraC-like DNA-binding protein
MNKQVSNLNRAFLRDFFHDKLSLSVCFVCLVILFGSYFIFFQKKTLFFSPNTHGTNVNFYTDKNDGGKSVVTDSLVADSCIAMKFVLKEGFVRPYTGISLESKPFREFDISKYNRVNVEISGTGIKPIFVYLVLKDSVTNFAGNLLGTRQLSQYIEVSSQRHIFTLKMNDFKTPDWWFDKYNLSPAATAKPDLNHLQRFTIATGLTPQFNQPLSLHVYSIKFYRDNSRVIFIMLFIQLLIAAFMMVVYYYRNRPQPRLKSVTVNYNPVTIANKQNKETGFLEYINENFQNSDLSLQVISKFTGVSQRVISEGISAQFQCNVKTYINQIRINEAVRLLKETDLNISEIAYKVGFSSPSNFNRVFKNLTGKTPSDFLQKKE